MAIYINEELKGIKGYYCGYCDEFHTEEEIKKTYTVEVIGDNAKIIEVEKACAECGKSIDLEEFEPEWWSHLAALVKVRYNGKVWIKVPLYDSENDMFPKAYKTVRTVEEVEELAGRYCIEVVRATIDEFDLMDIEVEFE